MSVHRIALTHFSNNCLITYSRLKADKVINIPFLHDQMSKLSVHTHNVYVIYGIVREDKENR